MRKKYSKILAIHWQGKVLLPAFMPFGIATGCRTLQLILDVIQQALRISFPKVFCPHGVNLSDHYLDDKGAMHYSEIGAWLQCVLWIVVVWSIGLPFSPSKIQLPRKIVDLLGFTINLTSQSYSLKAKKAISYLKFVCFY